ncbi:uncharacterized protein ASCRUDRAFT_150948 [Ascoidea rubescens DSM 1968]|uniref:Uncharacterized protein n=1 Tax=Ascoidea rubescens DSM 1968 TaxID=1344418 RepID=A0A1D2VGS4_9ASCO|nr:hypothetical protein ASCRUDRAFT_150948 [Ascoidea rubescens DSM 1968]ODV60858.1 hypothetical protein ASCRUDRAFT_150948 [Ascoidea rubescens DSM 1968]
MKNFQKFKILIKVFSLTFLVILIIKQNFLVIMNNWMLQFNHNTLINNQVQLIPLKDYNFLKNYTISELNELNHENYIKNPVLAVDNIAQCEIKTDNDRNLLFLETCFDTLVNELTQQLNPSSSLSDYMTIPVSLSTVFETPEPDNRKFYCSLLNCDDSRCYSYVRCDETCELVPIHLTGFRRNLIVYCSGHCICPKVYLFD